jgi:hypothetical protein
VIDMADVHQSEGATDEDKSEDKDKWSPELLAASVTIIVTLLAEGQSRFRFLPDGSEVGIAAALTVVTAAVLQRAIYRWRAFAQFAVTLISTLVIIAGFAFGVYWYDTAPGRDAQHEAAAWSPVKVPTEPQGKRLTAGVTKYGTGYGYQEGRQTFVHMDSSQSNLISWLPSASTSGTYYAQADVRELSGSDATACELSFAWKNENSAFELSLRSDGVQLAYWDGKLPARVFEGPVAVPYAANLGDWHTIAVLVEGSQVTAFVDNTRVFSDYVAQSLAGGVDFGTMDIGNGYTDDATCEFQNVVIRTQR